MRATRGKIVAVAITGAAALAAVGVGTGAMDGLRSGAELREQVNRQIPQVVQPQPSASSTGGIPPDRAGDTPAPPWEPDEFQDQTEDEPEPHRHESTVDRDVAPAPRETIARPDRDSDLRPTAEKARKEQDQREQESRPGEPEREQGQPQGEQDQRIQKPVREQRDPCHGNKLRAMPCRRSPQRTS